MGKKNQKDKSRRNTKSEQNERNERNELKLIQKRLTAVEKLLKSISDSLRKAHFYDYIQYVSDEKRIMRRSFLLGMLKGVGAAIGFSMLGGLAVYILHIIAQSNLPYIADFISDIIDIIENTGK